MSAEMYNFHEAIDEMQRAEEEVLDNHKAITDYMQHTLQRCNQLLSITRDVDYDQDGMFQIHKYTKSLSLSHSQIERVLHIYSLSQLIPQNILKHPTRTYFIYNIFLLPANVGLVAQI